MSLSILNVGDGDTKLSFDAAKPEECERAKRIVSEMLRQGFAILVEIEVDGVKQFRRVTAFDANTAEYIISDAPAETEKPTKRRGRPPGRRVKASETRATGVARSAGGCHRNTRYVRGSR